MATTKVKAPKVHDLVVDPPIEDGWDSWDCLGEILPEILGIRKLLMHMMNKRNREIMLQQS